MLYVRRSFPTALEMHATKARKSLFMADPVEIFPSEFVAHAFRLPSSKGLTNFSFEGRRYFVPIYDSQAPRILLKCGRQVEKTIRLDALVSTRNGYLVPAGAITVGAELATMALDSRTIAHGSVTWVSKHYDKPCLEVRTRQGHTVTIAATHPMRTWDSWTEGSLLKVGDRIAAIRRAGEFSNAPAKVLGQYIRLLAYLLGDGYIDDKSLGFTSIPGAKLSEFVADVEAIGGSCNVTETSSKASQVRIHKEGPLRAWLAKDGLMGSKSGTKFIPEWVFTLDRSQTAMFLNRLWSTDGHAKQNAKSKYSLEYCSISKRLIKDVQALLWKFGIPSKIRENWPSIYKRRNEKKLAYILRIETKSGIEIFLRDIGALGKTEQLALPAEASNSNRDTLPIEVNKLLVEIIASRECHDRYGRSADSSASLRTAGLRETLKYPPTAAKIQQYVDFFRKDTRYNQRLVDSLSDLQSTDLYWDEIEEIVDVGVQTCVDFEVEDTHNFVAEGLVTHNSTLLGNRALTFSMLMPYFKTLYVSPTEGQTSTFSRDRISDPIKMSPLLQVYTRGKGLATNVMLREFTSGGRITLSYAFLDADRIRGSFHNQVYIDEFQDILYDVIPVIEESMSHQEYQWSTYSGTPKSVDNTIEKYWQQFSTQNEWMIPCDACGPRGMRHWNSVEYENIGKHSLICSRCGAQIYPQHTDARWVSMRSSEWLKNPPESAGIPFEGYRIPQPIVSWLNWKRVVDKKARYSPAQFHNEVLGLSYDSGEKLLHRNIMEQSCGTHRIQDAELYIGRAPIFMGVDWGGGGDNGTSYTVVSLGCYLGDHFTYIYHKRFVGAEALSDKMMPEIISLARKFRVVLIGTDYGGGIDKNDALLREFGIDTVLRYQYNNAKKIYFDASLARYMVNRTEALMAFANAIKRLSVFRFPRWGDFEVEFSGDFTSLMIEYNESARTQVISKVAGTTDDTAHSSLYCFLASMAMFPRPDILAPDKPRK